MDKKWIFGIDLGGTTVKLAILNTEGDFVHKWEIPTDKRENGEFIVTDIKNAFFNKIGELNIEKDAFFGAGIGAPGPVIDNGVISKAVNLGWENYPLKDRLEKEIGLPVSVENDANCAALGELWKGAGKGFRNLVFVTLGTGVGGGVITNGEIVSGASGGGGEIGHMNVMIDDGYLCNCGKHGCLETICSATGIVRVAKSILDSTTVNSRLKEFYLSNQNITSKDVFEHASESDELAIKIVNEVCRYLGYALGSIQALLEPEAIVIGGGVSKAGETLLNPLKASYKKYAFLPEKSKTQIILATLGNDAGVIGAGWLVKKQI